MAERISGAKNAPALLELLGIWLNIGFSSFGGGSATQTLIYQHFVTRRHWITPEAFTEMFAVVQFAPGINLIAQCLLIGRALGGAAGMAVSVAGMVIPSAGITIAMTALYASIRDLPAAQKALRGITPALVGMSAAFMWRQLQPPMRGLRKHGAGGVGLGVGLVLGTMALAVAHAPVLVSYLIGAVVLGLAYAVWGRK